MQLLALTSPRASFFPADIAMRKKVTNKIDHAALSLALEKTLNDPDPRQREQVKWMVKNRSWDEVASFCAYVCQCETLREPLGLQPWHPPPCHVDLRHPADVASPSGQLLLRMKAAGISRYHPDPLVALATAECRAAAATQGDIMTAASRIVPLRP